jgi:hypothetical protein
LAETEASQRLAEANYLIRIIYRSGQLPEQVKLCLSHRIPARAQSTKPANLIGPPAGWQFAAAERACSSKPYQFMMGHTQFNSHMFGAEHLMLEDEAESVDIRSRRHFAANIKTILTGRDQNCHAKHREALILNPLWRMSLSLNDDPERLQVLPPLDIDVRDKIIVLKVIKSRMPMPTGSPELDARFWNQLILELPAFLHHLEQWQVPSELADSRYGITPYQHPEIVEKLEQTTPELKLLEFIDGEIFHNPQNAAEPCSP